VKVYDTVNGHLVNTEEATDDNLLNNELFVCAKFQDDTIDSVVSVTSPVMDYQVEILVSDDHQCLLMVTNSYFRLFNKSMSKHRDIAIKTLPSEWYGPTHYWYDKDRGLVFFRQESELCVVRVTLKQGDAQAE